MFDLPGGSPEDMELLEETLHREIKEETDCDVVSEKQLGAFSTLFPYHMDDQDAVLRHTGVIYDAQITGVPREDSDGEDSNGCVWVSIEELNKDNATPFVHLAISQINDHTA